MIGVFRNEADILEANVRHHLNEGVDRFLLLDNESTDGTGEVLTRLARELPVQWRRQRGSFHQGDLLTALAREARAAGADWVLPVDADEFWHAPGTTLHDVLARTTVSALAVQLVTFIQARTCLADSAANLLTMTRRVADATGTPEKIEGLVASGAVPYVGISYPPKWIARTSNRLQISWGNHIVDGVDVREPTSAIICFHAPLRSRATLLRKRDALRANTDLQAYVNVAWHIRRWRSLTFTELDGEWRANSYDGADRLELADGFVDLVRDDRLMKLVEPWLEGPSDKPTTTKPAGVWGISVVRNEADIIACTLGHYLAEGLDKLLVADNGSTDGTDRILEQFAARDPRVEWRRCGPHFCQEEVCTALGRESFRRGASWILPFDADEYLDRGRRETGRCDRAIDRGSHTLRCADVCAGARRSSIRA